MNDGIATNILTTLNRIEGCLKRIAQALEKPPVSEDKSQNP